MLTPRKTYGFLLACLLQLGSLYAQQQTLNELVDQAGSANDSTVLAAKLKLARKYTNIQPDSAAWWAEATVSHALRVSDTATAVLGLRQQGIIRQYQGNLPESLESYFTALRLLELHPVGELTTNLYSSIGISYLDLKEYDNALTYQRKALALDRVPRPKALGRHYFNIANVHTQAGRLDSARYYHLAARKTLPSYPSKYLTFLLDYAEGQLAFDTQDYRLSADRFARILADNRKSGDEYNRLNIINNLVLATAYLGENDRTRALISEALALSYKLDIPSQRVYPIRAQLILDSVRGDYVSALNAYGQLYRLNDSLVNTARAEKISELENSLATQQKERAVEVLQQENELMTLQATTQRGRLHQLCIIAALLSVVLFLLYRRYRSSEKARATIEAQNVQIAEAQAQVQQELEEKTLLMQEIHHRAKNNLSTIEGLLSLQLDVIEDSNAVQVLQRSRDRIQSISLIHQQLYTSETAGDIDAAAYLHQLLDRLTATEKTVHLNAEIESIKLDLAQAVPIGLIVNEAVMNSLEHAHPDTEQEDRIEVSLRHDAAAGYLQLRIADNGSGYPEPVVESRSTAGGLYIIRGLVAQLSGRLRRFNAPGAVIEAGIPYLQ